MVLMLLPVNTIGREYRIGWVANSDGDLAGYKIYWGAGSRLYDSVVDVGDTTEYTLNLPDSVAWFIAATAYDTVNNESGYSNELRTDSVSVFLKPIGLSFVATRRDTLLMLDFNGDGVIDIADWSASWREISRLIDKYWENKVE
ncbi:MAG: hypothetical protein GY820_38465 [Gammaproteobacteria bacterium]|nr:hypothetical protein [Gammaproteobacteria bacterium]